MYTATFYVAGEPVHLVQTKLISEAKQAIEQWAGENLKSAFVAQVTTKRRGEVYIAHFINNRH